MVAMSSLVRSLLVVILFCAAGSAQWVAPNPVMDVQRNADGLSFKMQTGVMRLQVCTDSIVRVTYSPAATFAERPEYVVVKSNWPAAEWSTKSNAQEVFL